MRDPVVIGVDVGTTGTKALAVAPDGTVLGQGRTATPTEPAALVAGTLDAVRQAVASADRPVAGLALCGAMHSLVGLDADAAPVTPLLTWADDRAAEQADRLRDPALASSHRDADAPDVARSRSSCWWREREPETFASVRWWAGVKELVLHALTGELLVDHGTASGTGLRNLHTEDWDEEALALAGLSTERLARLVDGTHAVLLTADVGLPTGTPVVVGGADGPLANLGLGAIRPGDVACSIGTSGAVRAAVDEPWVDPAGRTFCYVLAPGRWVAGGATNGGGIVLEWLREAVAPDLGTPEAVLDAAAQAPPGSDGLLFLPHIVGERAPEWLGGARGAYLGLTRAHGRAHLLRAAIEGACLQLAVVLATLGARHGIGACHGRVRAQRPLARDPRGRARPARRIRLLRGGLRLRRRAARHDRARHRRLARQRGRPRPDHAHGGARSPRRGGLRARAPGVRRRAGCRRADRALSAGWGLTGARSRPSSPVASPARCCARSSRTRIPHDPDTWPWATFAINIAGAILLGWLVTRLQERLPLSAYRRPLLGTGFCGALTTFSTMQVELLDMLDAGNTGLALGYAVASIVVGFAAVTLVTNVVRAR